MTIRRSMCVLNSIRRILRVPVFSAFLIAAPLFAQMSAHEHNPAQLVQDVRKATQQFLDELQVWAWRDNPQGVDWNNAVTCEHD